MSDPKAATSSLPRRSSAGRLLMLLVFLGLAAGAVYALPRLGWANANVFSLFKSKAVEVSFSVHRVVKGDLLVTVIEDGNLESSSNIDIKCQVAGGSSILSIVKDGTVVKKGDKLVDLDSSALVEQINAQRITYEKARSSSIQADKDYEVAKISVKEYIEGTYRKELQVADSNITIALENLKSAQNALEHSRRMFRKGYVSTLELESQQFSVQRAQLDLDAQKTTKDVLERFTKLKTMEDLQSKVDTAEAKMKSETAALALEEAKLKRLEEQLKNCTIIAPADGMVVYANEQGGSRFGGQQAVTVEEGATVRERQTILRLPDLSKMQVKVAVHESKVEQLRPGMRARIRILERELQGTVFSIANQPEPTSFFSASVKEYATIVRIDGQPEGLKPGMTAEVEILVAHLKDVFTLPVASVVEQQGSMYCWAKSSADKGKPEKRQLLPGLSNDQFIEIRDGVKDGDEIILNPRAVIPDVKEEKEEKKAVDIEKKFGKSQTGAMGAPGSGSPADPNAKGPPGFKGPGAEAPAGGGPPAAGGPPGGPGGGGKGRGSFDVMQNDKDGDGKVSRDEAPEAMANFFDRMDSNGDGFIDKAEAAAARARRAAAGGGGGGPGGGGPGGGGPGGPPGSNG